MSHALKIYTKIIPITLAYIDDNNHVNNVNYLQWMQDIGFEHINHNVPSSFYESNPITWFVKEHTIEYKLPCVLGDEILIRTWIASAKRVYATREYEFVRVADGKVVAQAKSIFVCMHQTKLKPVSISKEFTKYFL